VRRDLAIVNEMRNQMPDLAIEWLSAEPTRSFLEASGEQIHPLSDALRDECHEFEDHADTYTLDAIEALWEMDKLLNTDFAKVVVSGGCFLDTPRFWADVVKEALAVV
jgi:hypothetical protein